MKPLVFFTIVSRNYLAYALTLMQSVAREHPEAKRYLCLADTPADDATLDTELFETVSIDRLALPHFQSFVFRYDIMELNTAVKPYMFAWLRERHPQAGIVYLDPDILVLRKLEKVVAAFADNALAIVTPHLTAPMSDERFPDELSIMRSGVYNCGFAAINAAHPAAGKLIGWWADKLEFGCVVDIERGLFTDQKWMDLVPGMFPDVRILRDDGYNVAYWNLAQRPVERGPDGGYTANGAPLVFVHFSGVVLADPEAFSKHQNRFTATRIGGLRPLYERYLSLLRENAHSDHARKPYAYGAFANGERILSVMRRVFRHVFDVHSEFPVREPFGMDRDLFNQACDQLPDDEGLPVSRLMYAIWDMRPDLQGAFNLNTREGREGFIHWYLAAAAAELGISPTYIEPVRERFVRAAGDARQGNAQITIPPHGLRHGIGQAILRALAWGSRRPVLARWYSRLPQDLRMGMRRRAYRYSGASMPATALPRTPRVRRELKTTFAASLPGAPVAADGVNMIGYARGEFGIAENVRSYARALEANGHPFLIRNFDVGVVSRQLDLSMERHFSEALRYRTNVFFINADQMHVARDVLGPAAFQGRRNIGFWVWELEQFPRAWASALDLVDEVWAPTRFVRNAIAAVTDKPVLRMPKAIEFEVPQGLGREHYGLAAGEFVFLYSYDFNSYAARKNPEGAIAAFRQAFAGSGRGVRLLVKSINGHRFPGRLAALAREVADDPRIEVRDGFLSREEMFGLQNCVDCYLSLHRAEGFGLGMAESMFLGKPVIATGYSGNMDFMDRDNSCLVDYKLVPVAEQEYPHWRGQRWAEPDVAHSAQFMRRVVEDREYALSIGAAGAASIRRTNSRSACADAVMSRLRENVAVGIAAAAGDPLAAG